MLEGIVARMIDAAIAALLAELNVERRHAEMLEKSRVVRAGAERLKRKISARIDGDPRSCLRNIRGALLRAVKLEPCAQPLRDRCARFGVSDTVGDQIHEMLEVVTAPRAQKAPGVGVRIDVENGVLLQLR